MKHTAKIHIKFSVRAVYRSISNTKLKRGWNGTMAIWRNSRLFYYRAEEQKNRWNHQASRINNTSKRTQMVGNINYRDRG
jgi:hypothetical protein